MGPWMFVHLVTGANETVADVEIPMCYPLPQIVVWGERFFTLHLDGAYHEAHVCFAMTPVQA